MKPTTFWNPQQIDPGTAAGGPMRWVELSSMERILDWMADHDPQVRPVGLVGQDEFTFDFLVALPDQRLLSFDTG